jgi:hypothetical protein
MSYYYHVFGLSVASDIACPELLPAAAPAEPEVVIREAEVPEQLENPADSGARWQTAPGAYLLNLKRIGRFQVRDGREIAFQPNPGVAEDTLRTLLLSTCLSILLHQRKLFALHCSGVHSGRGAVLFAGNSGMGKSTLVSAFVDRGYKMLADDMLALTFDESGRVIALPGFPQVKLWADSAKALGRSTAGLRRVLPEYERYFAPETERFDPTPARLHALYFLRSHNTPEFQLEALPHTQRFNALLDNTWQKLTLPGLGRREWHFQTAARLASQIYAARVTRPSEPLEIHQVVELIERDMQLEHAPA